MWNSGKIQASLVSGHDLFPQKFKVHGPTSSEMPEKLSQVQTWVSELRAASKDSLGAGYKVVYKRINHRVIGANDIPDELVVETLDDALYLLGKRKDAAKILRMAEEAERALPPLLAYLYRYPLAAIGIAEDWEKLINVCLWMLEHPNPGIYIREIGLHGIDSKFIETNKNVLANLLELVLPHDAIHRSYTTGRNFAQRFGFRTAPSSVRVRLPEGCVAFPDYVSDIALTSEEFAVADIPCARVFITENIINFLTLPSDNDTLIIWGAGYGFDNLKGASWLSDRAIYYWGDIDTHGLAILSELRGHYPKARSFLMDNETLLRHIGLCVREPAQVKNLPQNLTKEESDLFISLINNLHGESLRLEQERINFKYVLAAVERITAQPTSVC